MPPAHVTVWTAPPGLAGSVPVDWLSEEESARAGAYLHAIDRDRFLVGAAMLRGAVARHTGRAPGAITIERTCPECGRPHGRPTAPGSGLALSVAHAGALVVVATSSDTRDIGVDIEAVPESLDEGLLILAFSAAERVWLAGPAESPEPPGSTGPPGPPEPPGPASPLGAPRLDDLMVRQRFTRLWTLKEALIKATGHGLRAPLAEVELTPGPGAAWRMIGYPRVVNPGRAITRPAAAALAALPPAWDGQKSSGLVGAVAALGVDSLVVTHADGSELIR